MSPVCCRYTSPLRFTLSHLGAVLQEHVIHCTLDGGQVVPVADEALIEPELVVFGFFGGHLSNFDFIIHVYPPRQLRLTADATY